MIAMSPAVDCNDLKPKFNNKKCHNINKQQPNQLSAKLLANTGSCSN